jgi:hypothetical protein
MQKLSVDHELILGVLAHRGVASSLDLQHATGKSQATVSRLLGDLSGLVATMGRARATRYGLMQPVRGFAARQPLSWTDEAGSIQPFGVLTHLAGGLLHVDSAFVASRAAAPLPWFLAPLRAQGFLGRLHAQRLASSGQIGRAHV